MRIWTTPKLNALLLGNGMPVEVQMEHQVRDMVLASARPEDCLVLPYDDGALRFLVEAKGRGLSSPAIFVTPESVPVPESLAQANATVVDLQRLGVDEARRLVHFIVKITGERGPARPEPDMPEPEETCRADEAPRPAGVNAADFFELVRKESIPVSLQLPVRQEGEWVSMRGLCYLKSVTKDALFLTNFRPKPLLPTLKAGKALTAFFSRGEERLFANVTIIGVGSEGLQVAAPERLFVVYRKYVRVEPNPVKPIHLYTTAPGMPTMHLRALEISQRGVGFVSSEGIERGAQYFFTLMLPEPPAVIVCPGTVRCKSEKENGYRYGAELRPHQRDEDLIARYIMQREIEIMGMLKEL